MARKLRLQFAGATYLITSRGDRRQVIFQDDIDRESFVGTLGDAVAKTGWRVHALCLMPDHFHLVVETPQPNLVSGMKWFLGTYTARFNRRHQLGGHVFSGRYRSLLIGPGSGFLRSACDYVHLNPSRAKLVDAVELLETYRWSSYPGYLQQQDQRPPWLHVKRLLTDCELDETAEAIGAFARRMESRRRENLELEFGGIRRGWCFGEPAFRQEMLGEVSRAVGPNHFGPELQEAAEAKAGRIVDEELRTALWTEAELMRRRKGDPTKIAIATRLRAETTVTLQWIAARLHMGTKTHLSHLLYWTRRGEEPPVKRSRRHDHESAAAVADEQEKTKEPKGRHLNVTLSQPANPEALPEPLTTKTSIPFTDPYFDPTFD